MLPGGQVGSCCPTYAARLPAVELHNTFYRRPDAGDGGTLAPRGAGGLPLLPQGPAWRGLPCLVGRGRRRRRGAALAGGIVRRLRRSAGLRAAERARVGCSATTTPWPGCSMRGPADLPLALELPHPSWVGRRGPRAAGRSTGSPLVATDYDGADEPDLRRIGPFLYLRLRRTTYSEADLVRWARSAGALPGRRARRLRVPPPRRGRRVTPSLAEALLSALRDRSRSGGEAGESQ